MRPSSWAWVAAALALAFRLAQAVDFTLRGEVAMDFPSFWVATQDAVIGADPYVPELTEHFRRHAPEIQGGERAWPYLYPPPALLLWRWSTPLSYGASQAVWWAVNLAVAGLLSRRLSQATGLALPWVLCGVLLSGPVGMNLTMGQVGLVLTWIVVEASLRGSGSLFSAAVLLKASPAVMGPALLAAAPRRLPFLIGAVLGTIALIGATFLLFDGPALWRAYGEVLGRAGSGDYGFETWDTDIYNFALSRIFLDLWPDQAGMIRGGLTVIGSLGLGLLGHRERGRPGAELRVVGAAAAFTVLVTPLAWFHHLCFTLPGLAWAATVMPRRAWFALAIPLAWPFEWWGPLSWYLPEVRLPLSMATTVALVALLGVCALWPRRDQYTA